MRDRLPTAARASAHRRAFTVDVVLVTARGRHLGVIGQRAPARSGGARWTLPWIVPRGGETLVSAAQRLVRQTMGSVPAWMEQVGAFADGARHPSGAALSVCFAGVISDDAGRVLPGGVEWCDAGAMSLRDARQEQMLGAALETLRVRMDFAPIPFHLLPSRFTLSELQHVYELLLGRRLHKASFRRALHAAWLVDPTDEWRHEGRGRPAQLFRFAPRKRRGTRRGVRFTLL